MDTSTTRIDTAYDKLLDLLVIYEVRKLAQNLATKEASKKYVASVWEVFILSTKQPTRAYAYAMQWHETYLKLTPEQKVWLK